MEIFQIPPSTSWFHFQSLLLELRMYKISHFKLGFNKRKFLKKNVLFCRFDSFYVNFLFTNFIRFYKSPAIVMAILYPVFNYFVFKKYEGRAKKIQIFILLYNCSVCIILQSTYTLFIFRAWNTRKFIWYRYFSVFDT